MTLEALSAYLRIHTLASLAHATVLVAVWWKLWQIERRIDK